MSAEQIELVEAARLLRVAYHVAHRWALTGELKAERVDGRWFAERADVVRLVRERNRAQPAPAA